MNQEWTQKRCKPCEGGVPPLEPALVKQYLSSLEGWQLAADGKSIWKEFRMKNFKAAIQLIGQVADLAEQEGHHPDLHLTAYRKLRIELATHAIGGLSENDFILAAKIEQLPSATL